MVTEVWKGIMWKSLQKLQMTELWHSKVTIDNNVMYFCCCCCHCCFVFLPGFPCVTLAVLEFAL